jgi:hypothetical protein
MSTPHTQAPIYAAQTPLQRLQHHVTGAIERGEAQAIVEQPAKPEATHTPGPWTAETGFTGGRIVISTPSAHIATCGSDNAALIAAAPELLAALEALLPLADSLHTMTYGPENKSSDWKEQFDARAAIQKAKGEA